MAEDEVLYYLDSNIDDEDENTKIIKEYLKHFGLSHYKKNNGKLNRKFMDNVGGNFNFHNIHIDKTALITMSFPNIESELYWGHYLVGKDYAEKDDVTDEMRMMREYGKDTFTKVSVKRAFVNSLHFINTKKDYAVTMHDYKDYLEHPESFPLKRIQNPLTGRMISTFPMSETAQQIFKRIKLKAVKPKDINILNEHYNIKDNCVKSYLEQEYKKKYEEPSTTYNDIFNYAIKNKIKKVIVRDINKKVIDKLVLNNGKLKMLDFIIHDEHMYITNNKPVSIKDTILYKNRIKDKEYKNTLFIITDYEQYAMVCKDFKKQYSMTNYDNYEFPIKSNVYKFAPNYEIDKPILNNIKYNSDNIFNAIESKINLRGYLDDEIFNRFQDINKVRYYRGKYMSHVRFDMNMTYTYPFYMNTLFPVPTINDKWKPYKKQRISNSYFYEVIVNDNEHILHPNNGIYVGYELKKLQELKVVKEIKQVFEPAISIRLSSLLKKLLPPKLKTQKNTPFHFTKGQMIQYVGWMLSHISINKKKFDIKDINEIHAILKTYDNATALDNIVTMTECFQKTSTGILSNIIIKAITNLRLYEFNEKFLKANPTAKLNGIHTDSLSYLLEKEYKPIDLINKDKVGMFKVELYDKENIGKKIINHKFCHLDGIKEKKIIEPYESSYIEEPIKIKEKKEINFYNSKDIPQLVKNGKSFDLRGPPGYGKSYQCKNVIRPLLKDDEYYMTSTTIANTKDHKNGQTLQSLINGKSDAELRRIFKDKKYLIIDEAVQLTQDSFKKLNHIKEMTNINYIFLTDEYQCTMERFKKQEYDKAFIDTRYVIDNIIDRNIVELEKHEHIRYSNKLDNLLRHIKEHRKNLNYVKIYVRMNLQNVKKSTTDMNICYTNVCVDTCIKNGKRALTAHTAQGSTIEEPYCFHELHKSPFDVIYTALSRAKECKQIFIVDKK